MKCYEIQPHVETENNLLFCLQVLKAHISSNGTKYVNELLDGDSYPAEEEVLHVVRNSSSGKRCFSITVNVVYCTTSSMHFITASL